MRRAEVEFLPVTPCAKGAAVAACGPREWPREWQRQDPRGTSSPAPRLLLSPSSREAEPCKAGPRRSFRLRFAAEGAAWKVPGRAGTGPGYGVSVANAVEASEAVTLGQCATGVNARTHAQVLLWGFGFRFGECQGRGSISDADRAAHVASRFGTRVSGLRGEPGATTPSRWRSASRQARGVPSGPPCSQPQASLSCSHWLGTTCDMKNCAVPTSFPIAKGV